MKRSVSLGLGASIGFIALFGLVGPGCGPSVEETANQPVARRVSQKWRSFPAAKRGAVPDSDLRELAYGKERSQRLSLFLPPKSKSGSKTKRALIVFVHGGAWMGGGRLNYEAAARAFVGRGFAVATVDYRLSGDRVTHPAHAGDVATALGWLASHAQKYGYDARRVTVVGHSAGAHIAATIATTPELLKLAGNPAAFVGLEGIYDLPKLTARWPGYPSWFLNAAFGSDQTRWADASPTRRKLVSHAPWILVHVQGDDLVDVPQTDDFSLHLKDEGVKVIDLRPSGGSHGTPVDALSVKGNPIPEAIARFASSKH